MISNARILITLFIFSFIIRLGFLIPVTSFNTPLIYDDLTFFDRAVAYEKILTELSHAQMPSSDNISRAYEKGHQPPLYAFLLGLASFLFGKNIFIVRLSIVFFSSITTSLIFLLTMRIYNEKAAILSSVIHMLYPAFIGYSHHLFSETHYIFLLLLAIYFTFAAFDDQDHREGIIYAVLAGISIGLCGLTRAAILPFLFMIPAWLFVYIKNTRLRLLLPSIFIVSYLIILMPWQIYIMKHDENAGFLSTATGWYLHIGNNPDIPDGYGSSWLHDSRGDMVRSARKYAKANNINGLLKAHQILASEEIKNNFGAFLTRGIYKLRMFWSMDFFILKYIFHSAYPPMNQTIVGSIWIFILISYLSFLFLAVYGFLSKEAASPKRDLIFILIATGMAPAVIAFGVSRFHLPLLAILLPVVGYGAANLKQKLSPKRSLAMIIISILILFTVLSSLPLVVSAYFMPSTHYCGLISKADKILGSQTDCFDKIILRNNIPQNADALTISTDTKDFSFNLTQKDMWDRVPHLNEYVWDTSPENSMLRLDIYAKETSDDLEMTIHSNKLNKAVTIQPIKMLSWRKWQPSGIDGVEYMWLGGGMGTRNLLPDDELFQFR